MLPGPFEITRTPGPAGLRRSHVDQKRQPDLHSPPNHCRAQLIVKGKEPAASSSREDLRPVASR